MPPPLPGGGGGKAGKKKKMPALPGGSKKGKSGAAPAAHAFSEEMLASLSAEERVAIEGALPAAPLAARRRRVRV